MNLRVPEVGPDDDMIRAAMAYAAAGWYGLPVRQAVKHAGSVLGKGWPAKSSRDPEQIAVWFAGTDHALALHVGRSGAVVFDVDNPGQLRDVLAEALEQYRPPYQSTRDSAPGRGHYVFACPPGRMLGNGTGKLGGGWGEVRGRNGIIVVSPSQHEKAAAGGRYVWERTGPVPVLPAELAELLPDALDANDAATDAEVAAFLAEHTRNDRPATLNGPVRSFTRWVTAGKSRHDSARDATIWGLKEARCGYYPAAAVVEQIRPAFIASLKRERPSEYDGIVAWSVSQAKVADLSEVRRIADRPDRNDDPTDLVAAAPSQPESDWRPPEPVDEIDRTPLPAFPVAALPDWLGDYVRALAEEKQVPLDLPGVVVLGVLAACAGGRAVLEIRKGWREPANLYAVVVADPGHRKSPPVAAAVKPLLDVEQELAAAVSSQIVENEMLRDIEVKTADRLRTVAAKEVGAKRDKATADAVGAAMAAEAITVPTLPRLFADDVTPEALGTLLADHGGRMAVLSAEGGIFDIFAGRYSTTPNLDPLLKGHSGDTIRVDRKGRRAEFVRSPALTMVLAVQPEVLQTIGGNRTFRGRGLLARFLYALVPDIVGYRKTGDDPDPMTDEIANTYAAKIESLARTLAEWSDPAVLTLTDDARKRLADHEASTEPRLRRDGDLGNPGLREWASKMVGVTARLTTLLHLARHPGDGWRRQVELSTVEGAVELADYFTAHARATFSVMAGTAQTGNPRAERIRAALDAAGTAGLSRTEISDLFGRHLSKADLDAAITSLRDAGECVEFDQQTGGRPAKRYRRANEVSEESPPAGTGGRANEAKEATEPPPGGLSSLTSFARTDGGPCVACGRLTSRRTGEHFHCTDCSGEVSA